MGPVVLLMDYNLAPDVAFYVFFLNCLSNMAVMIPRDLNSNHNEQVGFFHSSVCRGLSWQFFSGLV